MSFLTLPRNTTITDQLTINRDISAQIKTKTLTAQVPLWKGRLVTYLVQFSPFIFPSWLFDWWPCDICVVMSIISHAGTLTVKLGLMSSQNNVAILVILFTRHSVSVRARVCVFSTDINKDGQPMATTSSIVKKWSQNICNTRAAILHWWHHSESEAQSSLLTCRGFSWWRGRVLKRSQIMSLFKNRK